MSVRLGLLALLVEQPRYGSALRTEFEARTGGTWPLNIGQVFTTLARLERDGLVTSEEPAFPQDSAGPERTHWSATDAGRHAVEAWWTQPVERGTPARDELAIKLALAVTVAGVDVRALLQRQRTATVRALQDYTRLKQRVPQPADRSELAWSLVLDSLVFAAEAEVRWLDHCEARVARAALTPRPTPAAAAAAVHPEPQETRS